MTGNHSRLLFSSLFLVGLVLISASLWAVEPMSNQEMDTTLVDNRQVRTLGWWETWQNKNNKKTGSTVTPANNVSLQNQYESWTEQTVYQRALQQTGNSYRENRLIVINRPINAAQPK